MMEKLDLSFEDQSFREKLILLSAKTLEFQVF